MQHNAMMNSERGENGGGKGGLRQAVAKFAQRSLCLSAAGFSLCHTLRSFKPLPHTHDHTYVYTDTRANA